MEIEDRFEESDLPYKVDLVQFNRCDSDFQKIIKNDLTLINKRKNSA